MNKEDSKYVQGLIQMVMCRMRKTLAADLADKEYISETNGEIVDFCKYVEKILDDKSDGEWRAIKMDVEGYPFSPVYGVIFVFTYDNETCFYGWNSGRYEMNFYSLPSFYCGSEPYFKMENYIMAEDILGEIGTLQNVF